jgi:hypothetical protein
MRQTRQVVCAIYQSILLSSVTFTGLSHRFQKSKIDCLRFVIYPLLALVYKAFLWWPLTVLVKQTRQVVHTFKQSILLRCLWFEQTLVHYGIRTLWTFNSYWTHIPGVNGILFFKFLKSFKWNLTEIGQLSGKKIFLCNCALT